MDDGVFVGVEDGTELNDALGINDGMFVGVELSDTVGIHDGLFVSAEVGVTEAAEGGAVGKLELQHFDTVGISVNSELGRMLGFSDSDEAGVTVAAVEGDTVGISVNSEPQTQTWSGVGPPILPTPNLSCSIMMKYQ